MVREGSDSRSSDFQCFFLDGLLLDRIAPTPPAPMPPPSAADSSSSFAPSVWLPLNPTLLPSLRLFGGDGFVWRVLCCVCVVSVLSVLSRVSFFTHQVGEVKKLAPGSLSDILKEVATDADKFTIQFPQDLKVRSSFDNKKSRFIVNSFLNKGES